MAKAIIMPRQGQSVESCIISKWNKKEGEEIKKGDVLFSYETDKASFDEESDQNGILLKVLFEEGDDVPVLENVCIIGEMGEDISSLVSLDIPAVNINTEASEVENEKRQKSLATEVLHDSQITDRRIDEFKISPRAKNLTEKSGVNVNINSGSGPSGRIIEKDITRLREDGQLLTRAASDKGIASELSFGTGLGGRINIEDLKNVRIASDDKAKLAHNPEYTDIKMSNIRKVIAETMHSSLSNGAQLTLNTSFDATGILSLRKSIKESGGPMGNITLNDLILYAVSRTLPKHPYMNAWFLDNTIRLFKTINLGVAIDTERGLMVPSLFNADIMTLSQISAEVKSLAEKCQAGRISPDMLEGGTFTVTNLGFLGIESFTPVINPPQTAIIGVNNITYRMKKENNEIVTFPAMALSLTFDHRAVDGAPAARFLNELCRNLENFSLLLLNIR